MKKVMLTVLKSKLKKSCIILSQRVKIVLALLFTPNAWVARI